MLSKKNVCKTVLTLIFILLLGLPIPGGFSKSVSMEVSERVEGGGRLDSW